MAQRTATWLCVLLIPLVLSCSGERRSVPSDTIALSDAVPGGSLAGSTVRSSWEPSLGSVFIVAGSTQRDASVIFPMFSDSTLTDTTTFDTSKLTGMRVDLLSRSGLMGRGTLEPRTSRSREAGCVAWPEATVAGTDSGSAHTWTVAFESGRVVPLPLDSLESLASMDSARLTADIARIASLLPSDTAVAFRGVPFFVRQVRRFTLVPATDILAASVTRRINQEANPREELLLLLAERDGSRPGATFVPVYHERVSGSEESIESSEILAAVMLDAGTVPALVLIRDYGDGTTFALLKRTALGTWQVQWSSAYAGC